MAQTSSPSSLSNFGYASNSLCAAGPYPIPERQSLTNTIQELSHQAGQTRELAERLRMALDSQYAKDSNAGCAVALGQVQPTPHLCENLDVISDRLCSANSNLESLLEFVGR